MPSLSSMRALDPAGDKVQPLGPPIRESEAKPVPAPAPTSTPGIVRLPDGKLATDLPDPTKVVLVDWSRYLQDFVEVERAPKILGRVHDSIVFDDLECRTCSSTGVVHQESQFGCHAGGSFTCPDCDGESAR